MQINKHIKWSPCGVMDKMLDWNIILREFKLHLYYFIYIQTITFEKNINLLIPLAMG